MGTFCLNEDAHRETQKFTMKVIAYGFKAMWARHCNPSSDQYHYIYIGFLHKPTRYEVTIRLRINKLTKELIVNDGTYPFIVQIYKKNKNNVTSLIKSIAYDRTKNIEAELFMKNLILDLALDHL